MTARAELARGGIARGWIYQRERFPLAAHVPLIAAFSVAGVGYSTMLRGDAAPALSSLLVAFSTALLFFFQLRVLDEIKDAADDARYRPYRPVPRGLVSLRELSMCGIVAGAIQLGLAIALDPRLVPLLVVVWAYMALMGREFFVSRWLRARPLAVILTHMPVMPLIDLYMTACDWVPAGAVVPGALRRLLLASFLNGIVIEIGRKVRSREREEAGVETYTALWGAKRAIATWLTGLTLALCCAVAAAQAIGAGSVASAALVATWLIAAAAGVAFARSPVASRARWMEPASAGWTLAMYLVVGILPLLRRLA